MSSLPSGIRLMNLLRDHLTEIMDRERANLNSIHLYCTGSLLGSRSSVLPISCVVCFRIARLRRCACSLIPFPIVMVSVTDRSLRSYARKHILRRDETDYKLLTVPGLPMADYHVWHAGEVEGLPQLT